MNEHRRLPDTRNSVTHKFTVGEQEGYLTVGLYEDGNPGEIFLNVAKGGSTVSGLLDAIAILVSVALQHGVPLDKVVRKMRNMRFEPAGMTKHPEIPFATSVIDYVGHWLGNRFSIVTKTPDAKEPVQLSLWDEVKGKIWMEEKISAVDSRTKRLSSGVSCPECGGILVFQEGCMICPSCGYSKC